MSRDFWKICDSFCEFVDLQDYIFGNYLNFGKCTKIFADFCFTMNEKKLLSHDQSNDIAAQVKKFRL